MSATHLQAKINISNHKYTIHKREGRDVVTVDVLVRGEPRSYKTHSAASIYSLKGDAVRSLKWIVTLGSVLSKNINDCHGNRSR
ncbi:hypothetical protein OUZ56_014010 [Daphnia magna]|uniref:Uncharacterized protein n=1 Tax=Daphnia magna TaxID=35525 RepID=A0ABQ9Z7L2_9CRUS|nr:hypothetical protein OUZ56_014010 [Daphnia magna]